MQTINITVHPTESTQIEALKAVMKALKIKFEIAKDKSYNPEFVAKIEKNRKDYKEGKTIPVNKEDFKQFLGL